MDSANKTAVTVDPAFANVVEHVTHLNVTACFQCRKCTNGCPVTLGLKDRVLTSRTIWVCSACETCTTRCPNEVDIAATMDALKEMAVGAGVRIPEPKTYAFHRAFLDDVKKRGRMFEGKLMQSYLIRSGELFRKLSDGTIREDITLGLNMFKKGRLPLLPKGIKNKKEIRAILK